MAEETLDFIDLVDLQICMENRRHIAPQNVKSNFWNPKIKGLAISLKEARKAGIKDKLPKKAELELEIRVKS